MIFTSQVLIRQPKMAPRDMAEPVYSLGTLTSSIGAKKTASIQKTKAPMHRAIVIPTYTCIFSPYWLMIPYAPTRITGMA